MVSGGIYLIYSIIRAVIFPISFASWNISFLLYFAALARNNNKVRNKRGHLTLVISLYNKVFFS